MKRIDIRTSLEAAQASAAEAARLAALRRMRVLDTGPDPRFDRIARLAAAVFDAPIAAVTLIDENRLWMKAGLGIEIADRPRAGALAEVSLTHRTPIFATDIRQDERFDGAGLDLSVRFYAAAPLVAEDGQIIGVIAAADPQPHVPPDEAERQALLDLADLAMEELVRDAEAAAARERRDFDQERIELALTAAGLAAFEWDLGSDTLALSDELCAMIGWRGAPGRNFLRQLLALVHPDDRKQVGQTMRRQLAKHGRYRIEHRLVRPHDGRVMWVASAGAQVVSASRGARVIGVVQDITARKTEEEQRETLVAELDHRVKNVLAAVQSLALQSARRAASLEGFMKTFAGRLKSMASAHQLLMATRWRGAGLQNIATAELGGVAPGQTRWDGPDVLLTPRAASALSLALHELATNAVKFGALSTENGRVDVTWRRTEGGGLELQWLESRGPLVTAPTRRGFGSTLLERVTGRELDGLVRLEHRSEGVRVVLTAGPSALASSSPSTPAPAPAVEAAARAPVEPVHTARGAVSSQSLGGLRVLIVEDALLLALELEAGLTEAGAVVVGSAADVEEGLRMLRLPIDAAVLDANLKGASVAPVAQALSEAGVPFVFATGYGDDKFMPQGYDAPVIRKPYDVTQVAAALAKVTGRT